jgi:hypothetical protein
MADMVKETKVAADPGEARVVPLSTRHPTEWASAKMVYVHHGCHFDRSFTSLVLCCSTCVRAWTKWVCLTDFCSTRIVTS